jgi:hypothetical protein
MAGLFWPYNDAHAATYCAPLRAISTGQRQSEQVADSTAELYGSDAHKRPAANVRRSHPVDLEHPPAWRTWRLGPSKRPGLWARTPGQIVLQPAERPRLRTCGRTRDNLIEPRCNLSCLPARSINMGSSRTVLAASFLFDAALKCSNQADSHRSRIAAIGLLTCANDLH